ncbi:P1 family peptidase [Streptomyces radicis]|uniref:Peptidase S58 family protein n=1 Tax=Streptomyces radicis TaxID=1750517 RepID=A0A3A9W9D0_9ACTN|nr:P1 family peptidase [Streptomyces radicis]RKN04166.1 peptidase S58 family protein [Streptomyces radicis]RKN14504.1 peptidase S58 family protein [Streptomyces radicis]
MDRATSAVAGERDALTDVAGLRVGHAQRIGGGWLTGTTVVLSPEGGAVAAVDVRGGGPGTRETDVLDPRNLVERVDAVLLSGGSAFGLDAASGVMAWLEERGRGFRIGPEPWQVVPIVPGAVLFDLGRGGDWRARPDAALGRAAVEAAAATGPGAAVAQGSVGAGTGAVAGGYKGGIGTASAVLPSGATVAALAAVNAAGSPVDPATGALHGEPGRVPAAATHAEAARRLDRAMAATATRAAGERPPLNTTLAVVATDAALSVAQARKLAGTAHDGLARAVRPAHLMTDGDTVFALATGERPGSGGGSPIEVALAFNGLLAAGADVLARAVVKGLLAAEGVETPGGVFPSYRELYGDR